MNAIEVKGLKRSYGKFEALKGIDFTVEKGSIFGFLGPNGAGKTTTLMVLTGLLRVNTGHITVLGLDPITQGDTLRSKIGCLLEDSGLYDHLTVQQNLQFYGRAQLLEEVNLKVRISETLDFFELSEVANKKASKLSRGMRQKTALARAMLTLPDILFLDEPTANLDPQASVAFRELILELSRKHGMTIFLNTHRLDEAQRVCDKIAVIDNGKLLKTGKIEELRTSQTCPTIRINSNNITQKMFTDSLKTLIKKININGNDTTIELLHFEDIPKLVRGLVALGANIYEMRQEERSLEDIYMELVGENHGK